MGRRKIMEERIGAVTFKKKPVTLIGPEIKVGQKAPDFKMLNTDLKEVSLSSSKNKVRLFSVVYSLETPVCDLQTHTFGEEIGKYPEVISYAVSMDLPFTQARYRDEHENQKMIFLSDYRDASFAIAYGVLIKEFRLLARSIFIVDAQNIVRYVEYVREITQEPNYAEAIKALKEITPMKVGL